MLTKPHLYSNIMDYDFDHGYVVDRGLAFRDKLMTNNLGWTDDFTDFVIQEYKKFMYLCMVYPNTAPSDAIDQVWHQHILYTKDYHQFCLNMVKKPIHHNPDRVKHSSSLTYGITLINYENEFGFPAPKEVWSVPPADYKRVDLTRNYVVPTGSLMSLVKAFFIELQTKFV